MSTCVAVSFLVGSMLLLAAEGASISNPGADATHGLAIAGLVLFVLASAEWVCERID
jgi:hypothetical protein